MEIKTEIEQELDDLKTGKWCADKTKFRQVPIERLQVGGFCCDRCKKTYQELKKKSLQCCARCRKAYYCSRTCQVAAWKGGHESNCVQPDDIQPGHYMMLSGLKSKGDLNGLVVSVKEFKQQTQRWVVKPAGMGNKTLAVTTDKLQHLRPLK
jgi:hypothetical protein